MSVAGAPVEVTTSIEIDRPVSDVAAFSGDPTKAPAWYVNIIAHRGGAVPDGDDL